VVVGILTNLLAEAANRRVERDPVLGAVGARLRALRRRRGTTLAELSELTGISVSTLSRLEGGGRKPTLELLLALTRLSGAAE
jgi:DNA-binding XRE family transcriptional regulator